MLVQLQEMYIVTVQEYVFGKPENSVNIIILINWGGPFLFSYTCQIMLIVDKAANSLHAGTLLLKMNYSKFYRYTVHACQLDNAYRPFSR